jgi:signal transduction histidine kinase
MPSEIQNIKPRSTGTTRSLGFVLVVDDEEQNRSLLRDPLEARGYEVAEAENGLLALQNIAARPPDVILLDLMMPKMDGFEVCRRLKKDPKTAHIPILMVTALSERGDRLMGIQAGANDFLNKPIDIQDVILRVGNAVYAKHLHDQLLEQFIQAQKMEVVGQLASGLAHDFNNILAVIMGYSDLIMSDLDPGSPLQKYTEEIRHASERAAGLTRQLLVFSRKPTVQPVVLDLNDAVQDLDKMLRRLIGENIEMTMVPGKQTGRVKADSGHVGQVLMNLVVNARDAMPNGGKLTIATNNVTLDENYAHTHPGAIPGDYVMLSVSDTGTGMTDEVKARLFEAFFTTKPKGKGTGLGLATCQTIVQQSGGHIGVYSEIGKGTTFKIYFPRVEQPLDDAARTVQTGPLPRGTETLLVVEDEPSVRHLTRGVLETQGYEVLSASNGQDALHVAREHKGSPIRLVVTDVIMPLMGGEVMAEWLKTTYPDLKILFTSGYTDDAITHHGVLEPRVAFLPKPYTPGVLARKVRAMLDNETDTTYLRKQGVTINQSPPGST